MKKSALMLSMACVAFLLLSFVTRKFNDPWPVPEKYQKMTNPVKAEAASLEKGKALWGQHCKSCHGTKGKGDGPKAAQLDTECGDFTTADFQKQSDGALYFKTFEGRKDMPSFKKKITDENDLWAVVNYMRSLK